MTDLYEPKAPFRAEGDGAGAVKDGNDRVVAFSASFAISETASGPMEPDALAARIAAALNAEGRVKELEAFRAQVARLTLEGEPNGDGSWHSPACYEDQHETLEALIRQARNLTGGPND